MIHVLRPVFAAALVALSIVGCAQSENGVKKADAVESAPTNVPTHPMRFTLSGTPFAAFSCVVDGPFRRPTLVPAKQLTDAKGFLRSEIVSVQFVPGARAYEEDVLIVNQTKIKRPMRFQFPRGSFAVYGAHNQSVGVSAVLSVEKVSSKPGGKS